MIKIIEKTTGTMIARSTDIVQAFQLSRQRKCKPHNMIFVVGAPDVQLHDFAENWVSMYKWLTACLIRNQAQEYFIESASSRLALWQKIKDSREVAREDEIAPHLGAIIGYELHEDIETLMRLQHMPGCYVTGPDMKARWREAHQKGAVLGLIHGTKKNLVLAIHEELGALVVAPAEMLAGRGNFIIRNRFWRSGPI